MAGWSTHTGLAVALPMDAIDTDQLIPARFMSIPRSEGYGPYLLHDLRQDDPDFPLTRHPDASILITGRNFGVGSSREAAVYALVDAGFRAVIAPSFGDIFASNAVNNGLLPLVLDSDQIGNLATQHHIEIDLNTVEIIQETKRTPFTLTDNWRTKLINGWDDIDLTKTHTGAIADFAIARREKAPWSIPNQTGATRSG